MQSVPADKTIKQENRISRARKIENNGGTLLMPPVSECEYLLNWWQDAGVIGYGAMGMLPLSCRDINEWQDATGIELTPWEFNTMREMSKAYVSQSHDSEKPECHPPYGTPEMIFDRGVVAKKISSAFKSFMLNQNNGK